MLDKIRIILINTSHPGNIGSVARAMKTMGLKHLYLVNPQQFPHSKAYEMASGAADILDKATILKNLDDAIHDCTFIAGTSARVRTIKWSTLTPRELTETISQEPSDTKIAILFGQEQCGLTNEELQRCHVRVHIPTHHAYSSLNLGAAVQVIAYELQVAFSDQSPLPERGGPRLGTAEEMEHFFVHLQSVLTDIDF